MPNKKAWLWRGALLFGLALFIAIALALWRKSAAHAKPWQDFSGERALAHVQALVDLGPRPPASMPIEKARSYIRKNLEESSWKIEEERFSDETPRGLVVFVNLIATRRAARASKAQRFLLCSHYDTKPFDSISFVGANDGGSSTGALLEMARVLNRYPELAEKIELVFFDGEEAYDHFSATDGLYGSRYFARQLREAKSQERYRGAIVWDMMGDRDLTITLPPDSPTEMVRGIFAAAEALQARNHFTYLSESLLDDHTSLIAAGIPAIDLIDFDYPPWHTADDTMDKLSAESLQTVGAVTLYYLSEFAFR
jgi:glutaminyl-peptide cyclotransferase